MKYYISILFLLTSSFVAAHLYAESTIEDDLFPYIYELDMLGYKYLSEKSEEYSSNVNYVLNGEIKFRRLPEKGGRIEIDLLFDDGNLVNVGQLLLNENSDVTVLKDSIRLSEKGRAIIGVYSEDFDGNDIESANLALVPENELETVQANNGHLGGAGSGVYPSKNNPYALTNPNSYVGQITPYENSLNKDESVASKQKNKVSISAVSNDELIYEEITVSYDALGRIIACGEDAYSWDEEGNALVSDLNTADSWASLTLEEWQAFDFFGENAQGGMNYLSAVANDGMLSSITPAQALSILQKLFDDYVFHDRPQWVGMLPAKGISFKRCTGVNSIDLNCLSGMTKEQFFGASGASGLKLPAIEFDGTEDFSRRTSLDGTDLSKCTGLTAAQIMQVKVLRNAKLPAIAFAGTEDFTGKTMSGVDLSRCTGLTVQQVITMDAWTYVKFPAIVFTGTENFSGKSISGTDFSKCTGITLAQIKSASDVDGLKWPNVSFSPEDTLAGVRLWNADLSACTQISGAQILTASTLQYSIFPAITFTGNENFTGKNLQRVDISKTTGITSAQLLSTFTLSEIKVTSAQFQEYEAAIRAKSHFGYVYIDGVRIKLE